MGSCFHEVKTFSIMFLKIKTFYLDRFVPPIFFSLAREKKTGGTRPKEKDAARGKIRPQGGFVHARRGRPTACLHHTCVVPL